MTRTKYVILDPSGNLTALVTEWGGPAEEKEITARLMRESEQVAYLEPPTLPGSLGRIRLMGGEFCGNAAMAAAGWLARESLRPGERLTVPIEMSGARGILRCEILGLRDGFEGSVGMPGVLSILKTEKHGEHLTEVRMEGITHLIRESAAPLEKSRAEALLRELAAERTEEAIGLMDLNPETNHMRPLVYVRGSGTMVWETACGSGSAAVGAARAAASGNGAAEIPVAQPGGIIRASAEVRDGRITSLRITGRVRIGEERILEDSAEAGD